MEEVSFSERVYESLRRVPKGKVTTYKDLAHAIGSKNYRAVGQALRRNPDAPATPCHRVVKTDGTIGGFRGDIAGTAIDEKIALLQSENVFVEAGKVVDFEHKRFDFL